MMILRRNWKGKKCMRETYDSVIKRMLEDDELPSMEEMFREADKIKNQKRYSTKELLDLIHARRGKI